MTREIVELPDRKSGDINEIRDKKIALAKDATAQSDLPQQLEYLIKNGQTGEFMNVLDSYINEKIRSALGSLIASLDKGAAGTTKAIACIDTNNDLGIINPANLASVLGEDLRVIVDTESVPLHIKRDIGNWPYNASFDISLGFQKNTGYEESLYLEVNKNSKELTVVSSESAPFGIVRDFGSFTAEAPLTLDFFAKTTSAISLIGYLRVNKNSGELYWENSKTGASTKLA